MTTDGNNRRPALPALLIAPDRELAQLFGSAQACRNGFEVISELNSYPAEQTLDIRLRQSNPEVVLLDVSSNPDRALELITHMTQVRFDVSIVALDRTSRPDMVLQALRCGASEYLFAPFDETDASEAVSRILRLRKPEVAANDELGRVIAFSSVKPGAGATTLAVQTAFALKRRGAGRVLLVDLDLTGGSIGFCLKLEMSRSIADAAEHAEALGPSIWSSLIGSCEGVDVLPAAPLPCDEPADSTRLQAVLDYARTVCDWIVIDLPAVPHRTALISMSQADHVFLVSTAELASLHLARRAVKTLDQLGFARERRQMIINRVDSPSRITPAEAAALLQCPVYGTLPNDYFSLHRVVTLGQSLQGGALGRAIEQLAAHAVTVLDSLKAQMSVASAGAAPAYSVA